MGLPSKGHTLIEVCVVLLLISLIAGSSFSLVQVSSSFQVRLELDRLATVVTYLQRKAHIEQTVFTLTFDNDSYTNGDSTWRLSAGRFGVVRDVKGPPADPKKIIREGCKKLMIGPDGITAGTFYLTSGTCLFALSSDASEWSCLRKYRYTSKWELL